jgi:hypothetical protein
MVIEGPLPARLDIEMLRELRIAAYAIIQALDGTLDERFALHRPPGRN